MENDFIHSDKAWAIAGLFTSLAWAVSIWNVFLHLTHYTRPQFQLWIVRILLIVPLYGIVSWLSMKLDNQALYFATIRDIYEAFVIYCFLALILEYVGGEDNCMRRFSEKPDLRHPYPLCCLPRLNLNVLFLRFCKQGTLQFVIIKPVMAFVSLVMLSRDLYKDETYQVCLLTIYNISYTVALYALLLFYRAIRDDVREFNCVWKFFAVKTIVFATYWQNLFILWLNGGEGAGVQWNNFVLCIEMLVFAVLHYRFFPWQEFDAEVTDRKPLTNMKGVLSIVDVMKDIKHSFKPSYKEYILTGAKSHEGDVSYKTQTWVIDREKRGIEIEVQESGYDMHDVAQPRIVSGDPKRSDDNEKMLKSEDSDENLVCEQAEPYSDADLGYSIR